MNLIPLDIAVKGADEAIRKGATAFQQFECTNCQAKQTMAEPNKFFIEGACEECGHITDIRKTGCNYALLKALGGPNAAAALKDILNDITKEQP